MDLYIVKIEGTSFIPPIILNPGKSQDSFESLELGGGFKDFVFSPLFGEDFQFD